MPRSRLTCSRCLGNQASPLRGAEHFVGSRSPPRRVSLRSCRQQLAGASSLRRFGSCSLELDLPLSGALPARNDFRGYAVSYAVGRLVSRADLTAASRPGGTWRSLAEFETGGGATGTIRPSTSPRMPTSGFEVRGNHSPARPQTSIRGCSEFERRGRHAGFCCPVHGRPRALLSRLLSKRLHWIAPEAGSLPRISGPGHGGLHWRSPKALACSFHRWTFTPITTSHRASNSPAPPGTRIQGNRWAANAGERKFAKLLIR
jgi:hypothetical protein